MEEYDVQIDLITDRTIKRLNKSCREKDKATDTLSFPNYDIKPPTKPWELPHSGTVHAKDKHLGVILFAPNYIYEKCKYEGVDFGEKLETLLVHSICHLMGYDHIEDTDFRVMKRKENELLKYLKECQTPK